MEEEEKNTHKMAAANIDMQANEDDVLQGSKNRAGSAPPTLDSSYLFLYQEDDVYTRSFTKGFINTRKDDLYTEFYEQYKHKKPGLPPPLFQEDFREAKTTTQNLVTF